MAKDKKSNLYRLKPIIERWPAITKPEGHVTFRTKIFWTLLCLIIYFILTNVMIFGLKGDVIDLFAQYRFIMAGASGSVMHLGIGPIVTASIILQLFVGAKIINLDLSKKEDKAIYQGTQKILVQAIFTGLFNWLPVQGGILSMSNPPAGTIPGTYYLASHMSLGEIIGGGYQSIFLGAPSVGYQNAIVPFLGTIFIFLIVVYVESSRIELPLAHGRVRGARGRYPIRLIYASNIPVILMSALLANVNMFAMLLYRSELPLLGGQWWMGKYDLSVSTQPLAGGAWYLSSPGGINSWLLPIFAGGVGGHDSWQFALKVIVYLFVLIFGSILFAKFWIETTNMGPEAVAKQIQSSGMQIPGFRRDGTGVLLTVGIIIRLYEDIAKEQAMEMHPVLRGFFGNE